MMVGTKLNRSCRDVSRCTFVADMEDGPCNTRFNYLRRDRLKTIEIVLIVSIVDTEVESVGTVDLDVNQTGTENVAPKINSCGRPFLLNEESMLKPKVNEVPSFGKRKWSYLSINDGPNLGVNPNVLLVQRAILEHQQTVCKAEQVTVVRHYGRCGLSEKSRAGSGRMAFAQNKRT